MIDFTIVGCTTTCRKVLVKFFPRGSFFQFILFLLLGGAIIKVILVPLILTLPADILVIFIFIINSWIYDSADSKIHHHYRPELYDAFFFTTVPNNAQHMNFSIFHCKTAHRAE